MVEERDKTEKSILEKGKVKLTEKEERIKELDSRIKTLE